MQRQTFSALIQSHKYRTQLKGPRLLIIGGDVHDWKDVRPKDDPLSCVFKLVNVGIDTLIIKEVKPGCGCTKEKLDKEKLSPGDTATLSLTLRIGGQQGLIQKSVSLKTNCEKNPQKTLILKANVKHPISLSPTMFVFNNLVVGAEDTSAVTLKNATDGDMMLSAFELPPNAFLSIKNSKDAVLNINNPVIVKAGESIKLTLRVKPDKAGGFGLTLKMKTTHPDYQTYTISAHGTAKESPIYNNK